MKFSEPQQRDLVLLGGGHSHLAVIRQLGMKPLPGIRVTLLTRDVHTPYSGMLPGLIAGHYGEDEAFIDLRRLCQWAGIRLFQGSAHSIDPTAQQINCPGRPPLRYDWLSINVGSAPDTASIDGAQQYGHPVKPIDRFRADLRDWLANLNRQPTPQVLSLVGGGAAGVELVLAIQHHVQALGNDANVQFQLFSDQSVLLPGHNPKVGKYFTSLLKARDVTVRFDHPVDRLTNHHIHSRDRALASDFTVLAVHAGAPSWLKESGLDLDARGFILVNNQLQSVSHGNIFAAGDCASLVNTPLPKSGVYAVRQGPVLASNLRRQITNKPLRRYRPQRRFLALLATGDRCAAASRGQFFAAGSWIWQWKSRIDRAFIRRFSELPEMADENSASGDAMRCGGCGAKVGGDSLARVLDKLQSNGQSMQPILADDAALITPPPGQQLVQSIDQFRAFLDDPYLVGRIGANHCLGDIYAMGAEPSSALALANIPYAHPRIVEDTLYHMMRGALDTLHEAGTSLLGGHTAEAAELAFGLTVNGFIEPGKALHKGGLQAGQALVLGKPLGTGTLLAANMRHTARGDWIEAALISMQQSNRSAASLMRQYGATACTDITGFGLLGHLLEMLDASRLGACLQLEAIPILPGAAECLQQGIYSTFHPHNEAYRQRLSNDVSILRSPALDILFDPQTAGGLLVGLPAVNAEACLEALRGAGYEAAIVGETEIREEPGVSLI